MCIRDSWCAPWSSKPVLDVKSALGEFDSHRHPPEYNEAAELISTAVFLSLIHICNAPVVAYITSDWPLDAGLAAQNMELMAVALGLGALYNGYLARITNANEKLKDWLGIKGKTIKACMLLGYPNVSYERTVPRKEANVIWK